MKLGVQISFWKHAISKSGSQPDPKKITADPHDCQYPEQLHIYERNSQAKSEQAKFEDRFCIHISIQNAHQFQEVGYLEQNLKSTRVHRKKGNCHTLWYSMINLFSPIRNHCSKGARIWARSDPHWNQIQICIWNFWLDPYLHKRMRIQTPGAGTRKPSLVWGHTEVSLSDACRSSGTSWKLQEVPGTWQSSVQVHEAK